MNRDSGLNKTTRIDLRLTLEQKNRLRYAAQIRGISLASFVLISAADAADKVIEKYSVTEEAAR